MATERGPLKVVIWSLEHGRWWAPNEIGYVETLADAGIYDEVRAAQIVERANIVRFNECAIPLSAFGGAWALGVGVDDDC